MKIGKTSGEANLIGKYVCEKHHVIIVHYHINRNNYRTFQVTLTLFVIVYFKTLCFAEIIYFLWHCCTTTLFDLDVARKHVGGELFLFFVSSSLLTNDVLKEIPIHSYLKFTD